MFRATARSLGVSAYALFMTESRGIRSLKGVHGPTRATMMWKLFSKLSTSEQAALRRRASKVVHPKHRVRMPLSPFNKFVRANFPKVRGDNVQRFHAIASLWNKK